MTDRHSGYIVVLEADKREDDAEAVITALRMVKGVLSVKPIDADVNTQIAETRVRSEIASKLFEVIYGKA